MLLDVSIAKRLLLEEFWTWKAVVESDWFLKTTGEKITPFREMPVSL